LNYQVDLLVFSISSLEAGQIAGITFGTGGAIFSAVCHLKRPNLKIRHLLWRINKEMVVHASI